MDIQHVDLDHGCQTVSPRRARIGFQGKHVRYPVPVTVVAVGLRDGDGALIHKVDVPLPPMGVFVPIETLPAPVAPSPMAE